MWELKEADKEEARGSSIRQKDGGMGGKTHGIDEWMDNDEVR